jgi:hypothetical protein
VLINPDAESASIGKKRKWLVFDKNADVGDIIEALEK